MSVLNTIFNILSSDADLRSLLATHTLAPDYPAIYDRWVTEDAPMPYMVISWGFAAGDSATKMDSIIILDVFTSGSSSVMAETIRDRLREIFERNSFFSEGEGLIRTHYLRDGNVPEPEADVVHWMLEFRVIYWDAGLINAIESRTPDPTPIVYANPPVPLNLALTREYAGTYLLTWELDGETPLNFVRFLIVVNDVYTIQVDNPAARSYLIHGLDENVSNYVYMATVTTEQTYYSSAVELIP